MSESPPTQTPVTRDLQTRGVPFRLFRHAGQLHSLEQAAEERGQRPHQVVRSILFRLAAASTITNWSAARQKRKCWFKPATCVARSPPSACLSRPI